MFELYIRTDNDAFQDGNKAAEVARILRYVATRLEDGTDDYGMYRTLFDANGNDVGRAKMKAEVEA